MLNKWHKQQLYINFELIAQENSEQTIQLSDSSMCSIPTRGQIGLHGHVTE